MLSGYSRTTKHNKRHNDAVHLFKLCRYGVESKIKKNTELLGKSIRKVHNHMAKSNNKTHKKRMDKNCHIPDIQM